MKPENRQDEVSFSIIALTRSGKWNIWAPIFKYSDGRVMRLAVPCGDTAPNEEEYRERLYDYLEELIRCNPHTAEETARYLEDMTRSLDLNPSPAISSQQWAYQITHCDWMNIRLWDIDWGMSNPPRKIGEDEKLPTLLEILECLLQS